MNASKNNSGFTLIELSIVLVIIGFIVSGIIVAQSMIRQSQINSAMADEQKYVQAALNFQQKYGALPGDFSTAETYWAKAGTCAITNLAPPALPATCNGNGNGQIETAASTPYANNDEALTFWQHLVNGQFIQGSYNASPGAGGTAEHTIGKNCPASRVDGAGFGIVWTGVITTNGGNYFYPFSFGHTLILGAFKTNNLPVGPILTTAEAYGIDSKYDDGLPGLGNIQSWQKSSGYNASCTNNSGATQATAGYDQAQKGYQCSLIFLTGF